MSYINVYEEDFEDDVTSLTIDLDGHPEHSFTDGEELGAASTILSLLRGLDNGEALVTTRDVF